MGWWWNSSSAAEESRHRPPPQPQLHTTTLKSQSDANADLEATLAKCDHISSSTNSPGMETDVSSSSSSSSNDISALYPRTMSCRSAFDYAFFCQSFGGQFLNVYRYGTLRSCSEHWSDFWFCMRTNSYPSEERERMIADRYRKKAIKYRTGPSSEDVWELRTKPLKGAFQGDFVALERQMEREQQERDIGTKELNVSGTG